MEFNNLHSNYGWIILGQMAIILFTAFLLAAVTYILLDKMRAHMKLRAAGSVCAVMAVIVTGSYICGEFEESLIEDFRANIQQKYDVDEVLMEFQGETVSIRSEESQNLYVRIDDKTYLFNLTQDDTTWEPTLADPPINGGMDVTKTVSAEDLLK